MAPVQAGQGIAIAACDGGEILLVGERSDGYMVAR